MAKEEADLQKRQIFCQKNYSRREFLFTMGIAAGLTVSSLPFASLLKPEQPFLLKKGVMQKRRLGRTGWKASSIGFGGGVIGGERIPDAWMETVIRRALDLGVNFIDTAPTYGKSEIRIGNAIKPYPRESIFLATKIESQSHQWTKDEAEELIRRSLERLDVKYIDLVQFHGVGRWEAVEKILGKGGGMETVKEAKRKGIVRYVGISGGHSAQQMDALLRAVKTGEFDVIFPSFNIEFRDAAQPGGVFDVAKQYDCGVMVKKAFIRQPPQPGRRIFGQPPESLIPKYGVETLLKYILDDRRVGTVVVGMNRLYHVEEDVPVGYLPARSFLMP